MLTTSNIANFTVRRADEGESLSGKITSTALRGTIVTHKLGADGEKQLVRADGQRGFHLERDVVSSDDMTTFALQQAAFGSPDLFRPDVINNHVSARRCQEVEAEGADLIELSGTGAISNATAINTALSSGNGKFRVKQTNDETVGWLRGIIPALGDGAFRIMVEEVG